MTTEAPFAPCSTAEPMATPRGNWMQVVSHIAPQYGGLSSAVPALAHNIAMQPGFRVDIAAFTLPGENVCPHDFTKQQVTFWPAKRSAWWSQPQLKSAFEAEVSRSSGLHLHGLWDYSTALAAAAARAHNVPYILSAHGMLEPWALASSRLKKQLYTRFVTRRDLEGAACVHALTQAEAAQYLRFGARCPIAVLPNGVDLPEYSSAAPLLQRFPQLVDKRIMLFMARLNPKKGLDLLLQAWQRTAAKWDDAHLVIAGPDSDGWQAQLQEQVLKSGVQNSVLFTGMLGGDLKWSAFRAADCFVLPSHSEGLSVTLLEAMGMGLPVIITRACNMPEVTTHRAGWEIDTNAEQLEQAMSEALGNSPADNHLLGQRGADLIRLRYQWPGIAERMAEVYRWVEGGSMPSHVEMVMP